MKDTLAVVAHPASGRQQMTIRSGRRARCRPRARRRRVLRQLMAVTLVHTAGAIVLDTYASQHRSLHVLTVVAVIASVAGFVSVAMLGARWGVYSNATESWSRARRRSIPVEAGAHRAPAQVTDDSRMTTPVR